MGFFQRLAAIFRRKEEPAPKPENKDEAVPEETEASRAAAATSARRFDDAMACLRNARERADEAAVLDAILFSLPSEDPPRDDAWDALMLLLADVLVARGDRRRACEQLKRARSAAALVLRGDLLCEGLDGPALPEDLDLALSLYSEALRNDIDAPGARERWDRLRARLGRGGDVAQPTIGATLLANAPSLPFTLMREVARGGAGVVYEARASLGAAGDRRVALKLPHDRARARGPLAHEARLAVRFRGPGVVPIFDADPDEGWLAMAWAENASLREHLRARKGPVVEDPRTWLVPLLETLAHVHAERWVHGDVKPANVLFDGEHAPWLGDFGLARPFGDAATPGSAGYVSPERFAGAPCDPRDDVYGIGRIVEEAARDDAELRELARVCLAPAVHRPRDASEVLSLLAAR